MNGSIKWSDESTREFIQLRYKLRHHFNGRKHQCEKAYSRIVDELGLTNVITPTQARKKWSNLLQKYMDIKGGYSTANADWPYFQILDQVVPLIRKEKIEKLNPSNLEEQELDVPQDSLSLTTTIVPDQDTLSVASAPLSVTSVNTVMVSAQTCASSEGKCKTETIESEPPRKRGRYRRAAQRARDRWWGAVEDDDLGSESTGLTIRGDLVAHQGSSKSSTADNLDSSQMEIHTFHMLESCSTALAEIREILRLNAERQETLLKSLQQTVVSQGDTVKELLATMTTQNATLIAIMTQFSAKSSQSSLGMIVNGNFEEDNHRRDRGSHNHQQGTLAASQQNLINDLSQETQDCENSLVETSELADCEGVCET